LNTTPRFSIIICSHKPERAEFARAHFAALFARELHEIIMIADAKSLCEGYNRGFRQSSGQLIVFSHDDVEFVDAAVPARLAAHLDAFDVIGVAGTTMLVNGAWVTAGDPHTFALLAYPEANGRILVKACGRGELTIDRAQALDGCFIAAKRAVVEAIGFDEKTFDGFHLYDLDFSFRAYLAGFNVVVCRDLAPIHASKGNGDATLQRYADRFHEKFANQLAAPVQNHSRVAQLRMSRAALATFVTDGGLARLLDALR
jgi:hypothetical protein